MTTSEPSLVDVLARPVVCVIGPHRSGTSAVARFANLLGYSLGPEEQLMQADAWNERGYWESLDFVRLNDAILAEFGGSWHAPPQRQALAAAAPDELFAEARELIEGTFGSEARWAWKDPRTTLTLQFWRRAVPDLACVVCVRNPIDACSSLETHHDIDPETAEGLWLRYTLDSIENSKGLPRIFVNFEDLVSNPSSEIERLAKFLNVRDRETVFAACQEAGQFVEQSLRHHRVGLEQLLAAPMDGRTKALYLALRELAQEQEGVSDHALDSLAATTNQSLSGSSPPHLLETARQRYVNLIAQKDQIITEKEARLREQQAHLLDRDSLLSEKDARLTDTIARLSEKDARLLELTALLKEKDTRLAETGALLTEKDTRIAEAFGRVGGQSAIESDLRRLLNFELQALMDATQKVSELSLALASAEQRVGELSQALVDTNAALGAHTESKAFTATGKAPGETASATDLQVPLPELPSADTGAVSGFVTRSLSVLPLGTGTPTRARIGHWRDYIGGVLDYPHTYGWQAFLGKLKQRALHRRATVTLDDGARVEVEALAEGSTDLTGWLDNPRSRSVLQGSLQFVEGWALSRQGPLDRVEVYIDGDLVGLARLGMPRPDVAAGIDDERAPVCGFQLVLGPTDVPQDVSSLTLTAIVHDCAGNTLELTADHLDVERNTSGHASPKPPSAPRAPVFVPSSKTADSAIRLACFTHDLGYGGGQLYISELLRQMRAQRPFECTVVSFSDGPLRKELECLGFSVEILRVPFMRDSKQHEAAIASLANWLSARRFNRVICNTVVAHIPMLAACRVGIPSVWAIHESYPIPLWCALNGAVTRPLVETMTSQIASALSSAPAVVFEAEETRRMYLPYLAPDSGITLPYGIDTTKIDRFLHDFDRAQARLELGFESDAKVILCIGTFEQRKQQTVLMQAFATVLSRRPDARLVLIGDFPSPYSKALRDYMARAGIGDKVRTMPVNPDIYSWYAVSDLFALVSDIESLPRTLLECMCFGVPALATGVFGAPELIDDGVNGFLVEHNRLSDLTDRLDTVLSMDSQQLAEIGSRASRLVHDRYDSAGYARAYWGLLDRLARGETPARWAAARD
jgi:D-inositol-3-phosphate glycosyltransferase